MKKKKIIRKAQNGYSAPPQEKDFVDSQAYQEALDQYLMGMSDNGIDSALPGIKPLENPLKTSTSRFQELNKQTPAATFPQIKNLSKPSIGLKGPKKAPTWGNTALSILSGIDALIPEDEVKWPVVHPTNSYNQNQYGTGSQAIAEDGIVLSNTGYKSTSKDKNRPKLRIPSNQITMKGVPHPVIGTGSDGQQIVMMPEQEYLFPNAEYVDEQPLAKKGKKVKGPYISTSYQNGGKMTPEQMVQFNNFNKYVSDAGYANSSKLNNQAFSKSLYTKYKAANPDVKLEYDEMIPLAQQEQYNLKQQAVGFAERQKDPNSTNIMSNITPYDGKYGPKTQSYNFPEVKLNTFHNGQQTGSYNQGFFTRPNNSIKSVIPKGKKLEILEDASGLKQKFYENEEGDLVPVEMKKGGKIGKKYISKSYKNGGELQIENNQFTPISDATIMIDGKSHKNGGTEVSFGGKTIEAEAGEPAFLDSEGNLIIAGNLKNPVTGNKFKHDAKMIAKKEAKTNKLMDYATKLVKTSDPYNKWENLKFNAGNAMMLGAKMKGDQLKGSKEHLSELQQAMLELNNDELETAKNGMKLPKAQRGIELPNGRRVTYQQWIKSQKKTTAPFDVYNTPASQLDPDKYLAAIFSNEGGKTGIDPKIKGSASGKYALMSGTQKDMYNKYYKSKMSWEDFKKNYDTNPTFEYEVAKTLAKEKISQYPTAAEALGSWYHPASVKNKAWDTVPEPGYGNKISIRQYVDRAAKNYFAGTNQPRKNSIYNNTPEQSPGLKKSYTAPKVVGLTPNDFSSHPTKQPDQEIQPGQYNWKLNEPRNIPVESDAEGLQFEQILPELYAAATNQEEPVWMQQYNPELFQDYNVSLQDRRNRITSQGRATRQFLVDNANAQAVLAAQEYDAINNVDAEEFRINQGIAQDVTNKNKSLLNEAQAKNLQLADLQYTRQATAKSKTKATNQSILNSVSNKVLQNRLENRTLQTYENLYPHFRYDENYKQQIVGPSGEEYLNTGALGNTANSEAQSTAKTYDGSGTLKSIKTLNPSELDILNKKAILEAQKQRNIQRLVNKI